MAASADGLTTDAYAERWLAEQDSHAEAAE